MVTRTVDGGWTDGRWAGVGGSGGRTASRIYGLRERGSLGRRGGGSCLSPRGSGRARSPRSGPLALVTSWGRMSRPAPPAPLPRGRASSGSGELCFWEGPRDVRLRPSGWELAVRARLSHIVLPCVWQLRTPGASALHLRPSPDPPVRPGRSPSSSLGSAVPVPAWGAFPPAGLGVRGPWVWCRGRSRGVRPRQPWEACLRGLGWASSLSPQLGLPKAELHLQQLIL